jgi:hypothetical protein
VAEPSGPPRLVSGADAEAALTSGAAFLEQRAKESYDPQTLGKPGVVTYSLILSNPETLIWVYTWCAADADTLARNFESILLKFRMDGESVSAGSFNTEEIETAGRTCRLIYASLTDWPPGEHHLSTTAAFTTTINDGSADFEPGDYVLDYMVYVNP